MHTNKNAGQLHSLYNSMALINVAIGVVFWNVLTV